MLIKLKSTSWLLVVALFLAAALRLWNLGNIPPHLTPDEASLGYNAYSILKTGRDEYGQVLPIIFKSFGDYKPGLYVYLTVPSVALLGLNEFAVRLPSALAGVITVFLIYLVVKELFHSLEIRNLKLEILAAFIAATNPWSIYFSRGAWEVNISLTLTLLGIYFFLKSLHRSWFIVLSALFFALTLITYQGAKLATGIVVLILGIVYFRQIVRVNRRYLLAGILLGFLVSSPIILSIFQGKTGRLEVFSVFSYPRPKDYIERFLKEGNEKIGDLNYYLFHSEILNFKRGILGRYFNHFSGKFLFFEGDWANPRHSAPYQGMLLLGDLILLVIGLVAMARQKISKETLFIWLWLVFSPLPSILSRDQVHAVRAYNLSVPLIFVLSFGSIWLSRFRKVWKLTIGVIYLVGFIYFLDAYFIHLPKHNSKYWEYGYKQIVETVTPIQGSYKQIKVQQSYAQPYIFFLFFQKYDPAKYQKQAKLTENPYGDVGQVEHLDNIYFAPIDWSVNRGEHGTLFVADTVRIPPEDSKDTSLFTLIKEIKYLNGRDVAFRIIEVK